ncbi:MAG: Crp/Fnr family transcriptional regulator [Betaproteobacteria bacterium]|jgi:CRP-like cAMP-binding protein|nr:Crp/Fnr family transcriptional regulator [Betaproteobacteria bacterium]
MPEPLSHLQIALTSLPLCRQLDALEIQALLRGTRELALRRGEILFSKGDPSTGFFSIIRGQIKLALPSQQGGEKVLEIMGPGQSFGEAVMFMDAPYPVFAQALTEGAALHISKSVLFAAMARDPRLARKMLAGMSMRLHNLIQDVEAYTLQSARQRLVAYLLQRAGGAAQASAEVQLPTSKTVIASRLNLTPETLSRVLHSLSEAGLIVVRGRHIRVPDLPKLAAADA